MVASMDSDDSIRVSRHMFALISSGFYHQVREMVDRYGLSFVPEWSDGYALLYYALSHRNVGIAKMLVSKGAEVNARFDNSSPLVLAVGIGDTETIRMLIDKGANVNMDIVKGTMKETLFHRALRNFETLDRDVDLIELFLQHGADLEAVDSFGQTALFYAVDTCNKRLVELFLGRGAKVTVQSNSLLSPIHVAVRKCSKDVVEMLLDAGAAADCKAGDLATPLHLACDRGEVGSNGIVELLVSRGADANVSNEDGLGALHAAASSKTRVIEFLLGHGADINALTKDGLTPLHCAADHGNADSVEMLLSKGAECDVKSKTLFTPLHHAVLNGNARIAEMLLEKGADINAQTRDGKTCLQMAVEKSARVILSILLKYKPDIAIHQSCVRKAVGRCEMKIHLYNVQTEKCPILEMLLEYGFTLKPEDVCERDRILIPAVKSGSVKTVEAILKMSSDVPTLLMSSLPATCTSSFEGHIPLHMAAEARQLAMAECLLNFGADVDAVENDRRAINFAIWNTDWNMFQLLVSHKADVKFDRELLMDAAQSRVEIVEYLLQQDAYINVRDRFRATPLHFAVGRYRSYGRGLNSKEIVLENAIKIAKLLLRRGANVNARDVRGETPLMVAVNFRSPQLVELLLSHGADVNIRGEEGSALYKSINHENYEITKLLLDRGARINFEEKGFNTPLQCASERCRVDILKLLLEYGADVNDLELNKALHASDRDYPYDPFSPDFHTRPQRPERLNFLQYILECTDANINCPSPPRDPSQRNYTNRNFYENFMDYAYCFKQKWPDVFPFIARHIIKAHAANMHFNGTDSSSIIRWSGSSAFSNLTFSIGAKLATRQEFSDLCEAETSAMKNEKIPNTTWSFYSILTASAEQLARLARNEDVKNAISSQSFSNMFPIYASWVIGRFSIGERRRRWLDEGTEALSRLFPSLPCVCAQSILEELQTDDVRMLVFASKTERRLSDYQRQRCLWYWKTRGSWFRSLWPKSACTILTKRKKIAPELKPPTKKKKQK